MPRALLGPLGGGLQFLVSEVDLYVLPACDSECTLKDLSVVEA